MQFVVISNIKTLHFVAHCCFMTVSIIMISILTFLWCFTEYRHGQCQAEGEPDHRGHHARQQTAATRRWHARPVRHAPAGAFHHIKFVIVCTVCCVCWCAVAAVLSSRISCLEAIAFEQAVHFKSPQFASYLTYFQHVAPLCYTMTEPAGVDPHVPAAAAPLLHVSAEESRHQGRQ